MKKAVAALESVVAENPAYKDSLTLLARAYYNQRRYPDAFAILQRSLALNKEDEIAWVVLGLAQLRLGQDEQGMNSLKGGLTSLARELKPGYRGYDDWDTKGTVRTSLRRAAFVTAKGVNGAGKQDLIQEVERLLTRIDAEEHFQYDDKRLQQRRDWGPSEDDG